MAVDENTGQIKLPKCPKCGVAIEGGLRYSIKEIDFGTYYGDQDWRADNGHAPEWDTLEMVCPNCGEVIARTVEEADAILEYPNDDDDSEA